MSEGKQRRKTASQQQRLVDKWNAKWPVGKSVLVKRDDGSITLTRSRSRAQLLGGHTAVIWVEGIAGAYSLERVEAVL
jgi:hypothetical protein